MTKQIPYHMLPSISTVSSFAGSWVIVLVCLLVAETSFAQNMSVNSDGSQPDPSAMLDVKSTSQGFLMPRMTAAQKTAITNPAHGLMVLQIDGSRGIYIHDTNGGSLWRYVIDSIGIANMINANAQTIAEVLSEGDDASNDTIRSLGAIGVGTSTTNFPIGVVTSENRGINVSNNGTSGDQRGLSTTVGGSATTSIGVYGSTYGTAANASGVIGSSTASGTNSYGVRGETSGSAGTNYAVYGNATGGTNNYAGYFNQGDVAVQNGLLVNGYADVDSLSINSAFSLPTVDGTNGQVMTTDGAGIVSWSNSSGDTLSIIQDSDGDTKIQVEESADEDIIRFDVGGTEQFRMEDGRFEIYNTNNVLIGPDAGSSFNPSGSGANPNVAVGHDAMKTNVSGLNIVAIGHEALRDATAGDNTAVGAVALTNTSFGQRNVALGTSASQSNTTGSENSAVGWRSLQNIATGSNNVGLGASTMGNNTAGSNNTAIGTAAGYNTLGSSNVFLGFRAGFNELGSNKLYIENSNSATPLIYGDFANDTVKVNGVLAISDSYSFPTSDGTNGQLMTTDGAGNLSWSAVSGDTLSVIQDSDGDTKIQVEESANEDIIRFDLAGTEFYRMDSGRIEVINPNNSVAIGQNSGTEVISNASAYQNTAVGNNALEGVVGRDNTAIGYNSLTNVNATSVRENTAIGMSSMQSLTNGYHNTAIGRASLINLTGGYNNTAIGRNTLAGNTSGYENVAVGNQAGVNATGNLNVFLGSQAGTGYTGDNTLFIENSNSTTPLIYGDFANDTVKVYGVLSIADSFSFPSTRGELNQVLKTNGAGQTAWANASAVDQLEDFDTDTRVEVEKNADEDLIRFTVAGDEYYRMEAGRIIVSNTGKSILIGNGAGANDNLGNRSNVAIGEDALNDVVSGAKNVGIGEGALKSVTGSENVGIGVNAGAATTGTGNVFLGYEAGKNANGDNQLFINNETSANPLIYGDFSIDSVVINGKLNLNEEYTFPELDGIAGQQLVTDGAGLLYWGHTTALSDADDDTKVQVEELADEDLIRFDLAGAEYYRMEAGRLVVSNAGKSILIGNNAGANDDFGNNSNVAIGESAMLENIGGGNNVAIGEAALRDNLGDQNIAIGKEALRDLDNVAYDGNTAIGYRAGRGAAGSGNIYIGYEAGIAATGDNQLYIDNSSTNDPLIYGDFSNDSILINGMLNINQEYTLPKTDGTSGQYIKTDGNGNLSWVSSSVDLDWNIGGGIVYNSTDRFAVGTSTLPGSYFAEFQTPASTSYPVGLSIDHDYTGAAQQFGLITNLGSASTGLKYGVYNTVTANTSQANSIYGVTNQMTIDGSGDAYGTYQTFSGTTTGSTYGFYSTGEDYNYMSGTLGIGTTTPTALLDVNGTAVSATGGRYGIRSDVDDGGNGSTNVFGVYSSPSSGGGGSNTYYGLYSNTNVTAGGSSSIGLYAYGATYAAILDGGNVGIGTTAPSELLHVDGGDLLLDRNNSTNVTRSIIIQGAGALGSNIYGRIVFKGYDNTSGSFEYEGAAITARNLGSVNHGALGFWTRNTTLTEWMRITRDGAVQIDPDNAGGARLQVTGDVEVSGHVEVDASEAYYFGDPNTDGSWRIVRSGNNLTFQRRESGSWVTKTSMTP